MLTITTANGHKLELYPNTKISIEENSPMFTDVGSYSMPLELPPTPGNLFILEHPNRTARKKKFINTIDVSINVGSWQRHAEMQIISAGKYQSIETTLYLKESPFYDKIKDVQLVDIFKEIVRDDYSSNSNPVSRWMQHLDRVSCFDIEDDFHVFPICLSIDVHEEPYENNNPDYLYRTNHYTILNRPAVPISISEPGTIGTSKSGRKYYKLANDTDVYLKDGEYVAVPEGYGLSPFLKIEYVLNKIFEHVGYVMNDDIAMFIPSFKHAVLLNNTADAIIKGKIYYEQLVPEVSALEFLSFIENTLGCRLYIQENNNTAGFKFWSKVLSQELPTSIDNLVQDHSRINFKLPENIKLTNQKEDAYDIFGSSKTYNELIDKHGTPKYVKDFDIFKGSNFDKDGLYYVRRNNTLYAVAFDNDWEYYDTVDFSYDGLDYYPANASYEEKDCLFKPPLVLPDVLFKRQSDRKWIITSRPEFKEDINDYIINERLAYKEGKNTYRLFERIPFLNSKRHMNSVLQTETTTEGSDEKNSDVQSEREITLPIIPCFSAGYLEGFIEVLDFGLWTMTIDCMELSMIRQGTPFNSNNFGNKLNFDFDFSLLTIFNRFWKEYDELLNTSLHTVNTVVDMRDSELQSMRFDKVISINGQKMLPLSISYEVSDSGIEVVNFTTKITRKYE